VTINTNSSLLDISLPNNKSQNPVHKVVVIKKSKIRQFMKMKKREKLKEQLQQQKEEIVRTMKMQ
jgi:hypothetical protein